MASDVGKGLVSGSVGLLAGGVTGALLVGGVVYAKRVLADKRPATFETVLDEDVAWGAGIGAVILGLIEGALGVLAPGLAVQDQLAEAGRQLSQFQLPDMGFVTNTSNVTDVPGSPRQINVDLPTRFF